MKKILLASTMLAAVATVADAETGVKISGYGRLGLVHDSSAVAPASETTIHTRLRFNIDATTETDSGVTFGGRIRLQGTNEDAASTSAALLYVEYEGLRVEAGNSNTAFDSAALLYDSELGLTDSSFGDSRTAFYSFNGTGQSFAGGAGVYASYSIEGFTGQVSYADPEHYTGNVGAAEAETSLALSYANDQFTVSLAGVWSGAGIDGNDAFLVGGAYKLSDVATVGLNYIDEGVNSSSVDMGRTIVLYGNYTMDAVTVKGYISNNDAATNTDDTAYGIGADYDLGGAKLTGGIHRGYNDNTYADLGVSFNF
jgi:outer membrane protein OmpU